MGNANRYHRQYSVSCYLLSPNVIIGRASKTSAGTVLHRIDLIITVAQ